MAHRKCHIDRVHLASHTALWIDMSEPQNQLPRGQYVVVEFPSSGERHKFAGEPGHRFAQNRSMPYGWPGAGS
jgi:hypothetical protein